jgi:hypothetical protein
VPTRHDFTSDHPLPVFLSSDTERYEEPRRSSLLLKTTGLFVVAAIVIGGAMTLTLGNPMDLFAVADSAASQADSAAAQPNTDQPPAPPVQAPPVQSTADAGQTAGSTPSREDVTAAADNAAAPPSGALLKQFQSWAAQQDAQPQGAPTQGAQTQGVQTQVEPVRPIQDATPQAEPARPAQDAATQPSDDAPAPVRVAQKHRRARPVQNARAEIRIPRPRPAAGVRPDRNARADARPPQDGRPPEQTQQAQSPSFLQSIGLRPQQ